MKEETRAILDECREFCDKEDKSTEFMIAFMRSVANVSHDCVINYLMKDDKEYQKVKKAKAVKNEN